MYRMPDPLQVLNHVLATVAPAVTPGARIPRFGSADHDLSVVATALLRRAYIQARGVSVVAASSVPEAGVPNLRSLAEAAGELDYLLDGSGACTRAQVAFLFALREIRDYLKRFGDGDDAEELKRVETEIATHEKAVPDAVATMERLRNYWVPLGRAKLVNQAIAKVFSSSADTPSQLGERLYKLLSWDEHHVMATLLSISLNPASPDYGCVVEQDVPESPKEFLPMMAATLLRGMWRSYQARVLSSGSDDIAPAT